MNRASALSSAARVLKTNLLLVAVGAFALTLMAAPSRADDYATIAGALASPLPDSRDELKRAYTDAQVMLRVELARQQLQATSASSDLAATRRDIVQHLEACRLSMQEIRRLDGKMPDIEAIAKKALKASPALVRSDPETGNLTPEDSRAVDELAGTLVTEALKTIVDKWNASNERDKYREQYSLARTAALQLAQVAEKRCKGRSPVFYGVGMAVDIGERAILVDEVLADGPAARAGLRKGDELIAVNGANIKKTEGRSTVIDRTVFRALRGERDTTVKLTYSRAGTTKTAEVRRSFAGRNPLLELDFDGSWYATFAQDSLDLRNISGSDLTNCTLLVTLQGKHGDSGELMQRRHLHFVDRWPAGQQRRAWYRSSTADGIAADQSLDQVQRVVIELYSDQYRDTLTHQYAGTPAFDEDVDRYIELVKKQQKFSLSFAGDNFLSDAGVVLQHEGAFNFVPDPKVTVTLRRDKDVRQRTWLGTGKPWSTGYLAGSSLKHSSFNGMSPDRVDIDMEFPGSSKKVSFSWDLSGN